MARGRLRYSAPRNQRSGSRPSRVHVSDPQTVKPIVKNDQTREKSELIAQYAQQLPDIKDLNERKAIVEKLRLLDPLGEKCQGCHVWVPRTVLVTIPAECDLGEGDNDYDVLVCKECLGETGETKSAAGAIPDSEVTNDLVPATAWNDACMSCLCNLPHGWEKHNQAIAEDLEELREQDMQYDDR